MLEYVDPLVFNVLKLYFPGYDSAGADSAAAPNYKTAGALSAEPGAG
jgi:hypothetical protein